jgi:hypothetical protein
MRVTNGIPLGCLLSYDLAFMASKHCEVADEQAPLTLTLTLIMISVQTRKAFRLHPECNDVDLGR